MKVQSRKIKWLALGALLVAAVLVGSHLWVDAREKSRVDPGWKLAGRWAADGNRDKMLIGGPMTLTGAVIRVWGHSSLALSFDGTAGTVSVPDSPDLAIRAGQDFSVTAWIQPMLADNSFGVMSIVEKRKVGGITTARGFSLHLEYGHLSCQLAPEAGLHLTGSDLVSPKRWAPLWKARHALAPVNRFVSSRPDLRDGQFHHVALTVDRHSITGGKLFVDGKVIMTFDPTKLRGSMANAEPLLIGTHPDPTLQCGFKGRLEDVRLYSRSLSAKEIETAASEPAAKKSQ